MSEVIKNNNSGYSRYEELLLRKAALRKECFQLEMEYTRIFGEMLLTLYRLKIECAKKKKTIEFCQVAVNRGEEPDEAALHDFLARETQVLQEHLQQMAREYESARNAEKISEADAMKIRKIYRQTAKLLHPDLHPEVAQSPKLQELWNQMSVAYNCNDLKEMEELEVLVASAMADMSGEDWKVEVPDLEQRITALEGEIADIMESNAYQYKFLLESESLVQEKKNSLQEEIDEYRNYDARLDEILASVLPDGMVILWKDGI